MKILKKILIITIILLAICQLNNNVYAYTIDEVKEIINYKTVDEDGEPEHYDVLMDSSEMIETVKFPCIQTKIEDVLYGDENVLGFDL